MWFHFAIAGRKVLSGLVEAIASLIFYISFFTPCFVIKMLDLLKF